MKCRMISEENGKVERRSEELATLLTPWTSPSRGKCPTARAGYLSLRRAHWRPMQQPPRSFRYRYSYQQQWSLLIVRQLSAASSEAIHSTALNSLSLSLSLSFAVRWQCLWRLRQCAIARWYTFPHPHPCPPVCLSLFFSPSFCVYI